VLFEVHVVETAMLLFTRMSAARAAVVSPMPATATIAVLWITLLTGHLLKKKFTSRSSKETLSFVGASRGPGC